MGNRLKGGITALLVAYVMLLHGLLGAYAQAAMSGDSQTAPLFVLCDTYGLVAHQEGGSPHGSEPGERCKILCQSACAFGVILAGGTSALALGAQASQVPATPLLTSDGVRLVALPWARGPPLLSV